MNRRHLLCAASVFAIQLSGGVAAAQVRNPVSADVEELVVTGSRVISDGTQSPTPLSVASADELQRAAPTSLAEGLVQLPALRGSTEPQNTNPSVNGATGQSFLSLRGLGPARTLVLLNGNRVGPSSDAGTADVSLLPENLVSRVEIVTGGASAAYGSDAVAGVVNFVLDTKFRGVKGLAQAGAAQVGDSVSYKAEVGLGQFFHDDRGHILLNVEFYDRRRIQAGRSHRDWDEKSTYYIPNPVTGALPLRLIQDNTTVAVANFGGLVASGPLRGLTFGPGGTPRQFVYGTDVGPIFMLGGEGVSLRQAFSPGMQRKSLFGRVDYDLTDQIKVFAEGSYADIESKFDSFHGSFYNATAFTIFQDNAFLPASVRQQMIATGQASFRLGRVFNEEGPTEIDANRQALRLTGGFDYEFSELWSLSGYGAYSKTNVYTGYNKVQNHRNLIAAVDAVRDPATGNIVCRSTLAGLDPGCVPLNLFGEGSPSAAALRFVTGGQWRDAEISQKVLSLTLKGEFATPLAGPMAVAAGVEYRGEEFSQTVDAISSSRVNFTGLRGGPAGVNGQLGGYLVGNPQPLAGEFDIREGFVEAQLPIVAGVPMIERLELNAAARITDYSTSGTVKTWKVGVVYTPIDDLRFRATRSRDIRAPNIAEMFSQGRQSTSNVRDPATGATIQFTALTSGNPDLDPEIADTFTAGVVYQPSQIPGLSVSVDYFDIKMQGAIASLGAQQTVDDCYRGDAVACSTIVAVGGQYRVSLFPRNLDSLKTSGVDFEVGYRTEFLGGSLSLRGLASRINEFETQSPGLAPVDRAGEVGRSPLAQWRWTASAVYQNGPWSVSGQQRYIAGGAYDKTFVEGVDINDNTIEAVFYTDATISRKFTTMGGTFDAFITVNNLFDRDPPKAANTILLFTMLADTSENYDIIGRYYTAGLRFRF